MGYVIGWLFFYDDYLYDGLLYMCCVCLLYYYVCICLVDILVVEGVEGVVKILSVCDVLVNMNMLLLLINFGCDDEFLLVID